MSNYTLEIISHHPIFKGKSLRQYYVDGINTVGVWGDEPFEIRFKNNTSQKIQVKFSVDGTDVLSGDVASTEITNSMWVVNGHQTLSLKAWPETNNGGAQLVFTSATNSVAVHTHGDLSCRGIIAAAVFVESYVEPIKINPVIVHEYRYLYPYQPYQPYYPNNPFWVGDLTCGSGVLTLDSSVTASYNNSSSGAVNCSSSNKSVSKSLESLVAVGAGQHVDQNITYVAGLIKPAFTEIVRIKYMWWDDLVEKLRMNNVPTSHASGFPGDKNNTHINLGKTPKIGTVNKLSKTKNVEHSYLRV